MEYVLASGTAVFFITFTFMLFEMIIAAMSLFKKEAQNDFQPEISIIIPAFNEEKRIKEAIISALNSDYPKEKIEVIVVDDGSADKTAETAESAGAKVVRQSHSGKVDALNLGIKSSTHNFIITLDADTTISRKFAGEIISMFSDESVGAVSGVMKVKNNKTLLGMFQEIEYCNINLIRSSFSKIFNFGAWFFGSITCYRKSALIKTGLFKKNTASEDMDIALELKKAGYKTLSSSKAEGYTHAPESAKELFRQRKRWWIGGIQTLRINKVSMRDSFPMKFILFNQYWWSFYALISIPIFAYQIWYWYPHTDFAGVFWYFFRWFTITGPFYVFYKIPKWGISAYSIFGVATGVISITMSLLALKIFKCRFSWRTAAAMFFFFPYTLFLNTLIAMALLTAKPQGHFIK
jgi:cellulose synthase/poly-beta-1,6-N-acetylglucosamine synthase-like glycosyltransferase